MRDEPGSNPAPGTTYIRRQYIEELVKRGTPHPQHPELSVLKGWQLRRHVWAIRLTRFACWLRGWHTMGFDPDWRDWYCTTCYVIDEEKEAGSVMAFIRQSETPFKAYDPRVGADRVCAREDCGHAYYRHFDTYEEMAPVGCKYCPCEAFLE